MKRALIILLLLVIFFFPVRHKISTQAVPIPAKQVFITTPTDATIKSILHNTGDFIEQETPIIYLQNKLLEHQLTENHINITKNYIQINYIDKFGTYTNKTQISFLLNGLKKNQLEFATAQGLLEQLIIKSPIDGYIVSPSLTHKIGNLVPAKTTLISIADMSELKLLIPIHENDLHILNYKSKFKGCFVGAMTNFEGEIDILPTKRASPEDYPLAFLAIYGGSTPIENGKNTSFPIYIAEAHIKNPNRFFVNGMRAHVTIYGPMTFLAKKIFYKLFF